MPDGTLLHLRDIYPIETAWAPKWVGGELRRSDSAPGKRTWLRSEPPQKQGQPPRAATTTQRRDIKLRAASYQAMHHAYREREAVFATTMADRADWEQETRHQRRRHPDQRFPALRSAEPEPATQAQRDVPTMTAWEEPGEMGEWIKLLTAEHQMFADKLGELQSMTIPSEDPDYADLGQAFPPWNGRSRDAILQPPKPEIRPSPQVVERVTDRDRGVEAAN